MRRTQIIATIGPASETPAVLPKLLRAGVDVVRVNFSHGDTAEFTRIFRDVRAIARKLGRHIPIMQDLQGPKLRVGEIALGTTYRAGQTVTVTTRAVIGNTQVIPVSYAKLPREVKRGDTILLRDGEIELKVLATGADELTAKVIRGGALTSHQGFNVPSVRLSTSAITAKDRTDLAWGLAHRADWIAVSFVKSAADITSVKRLIAKEVRGPKRPKVIAKIEKHEAIANLAGIIAAADGVMVARGDLGVECDPAEVPFLQKKIIHAANRAGKPVITATQLLESMVEHSQPTRAEVSDVAGAVLDGTDATMLSEETAVGHFPVEAVRTMRHVISDAERHQRRHRDAGLDF